MSTVITDNPYTFTVEDNMSIKAVFEDNVILLDSITCTYTGNSAGTTGTYTNTAYYDNTSLARASATGWAGGSPGNFSFKIVDGITLPMTLQAGKVIKHTVSNTGYYNYYLQIWDRTTSTKLTSIYNNGTYTLQSSLNGHTLYLVLSKSA